MYPSQIEFLKYIADEYNYLLHEYKSNSFEDFTENKRLSKAICRSLEIVGEASNRIHPDIKSKYPLIAWREIGDMRNKIIHHFLVLIMILFWIPLKQIFQF